MTYSSSSEALQGKAVGRLHLAFGADSNGRSYVARQYASYPFHVCRALYLDPELPKLTTLYLQSCAGGLYRDDVHEIGIAVGVKAEAHVTTQASTIVHGMEQGRARQVVNISALAGAYLEFLPDPLILFPFARLDSKATISLEVGATVLFADAYLLHNPTAGDLLFSSFVSDIEIRNSDGTTLAVDRIGIDTRELDPRRVGIMRDFRAQGSFLAATLEDCTPLLDELRSASSGESETAFGLSRLPHSAGVIARILASDALALRRAMHRCWSACRRAIKGSAALPRRK